LFIVLIEEFSNVFSVGDELYQVQDRALRHTTVNSRLTVGGRECLSLKSVMHVIRWVSASYQSCKEISAQLSRKVFLGRPLGETS